VNEAIALLPPHIGPERRCLEEECRFLYHRELEGYVCTWGSYPNLECEIRRKTIEKYYLDTWRKIGEECPAPLGDRPRACAEFKKDLRIPANSARAVLSAKMLLIVKDYLPKRPRQAEPSKAMADHYKDFDYLRLEAEHWIFGEQREGDAFSFNYICELIGVDAERARKVLFQLAQAGVCPDYGLLVRKFEESRAQLALYEDKYDADFNQEV